MEEIFKDIPGYYGMYQISNLGGVKSLARIVKHRGNNRALKEKIMRKSIDSKGYYMVWLSRDGNRKNRLVHQLVAEVFLNHVRCGYTLVVNHKDFNKLNNSVENLEIVTARENSNRKHIKSSSQYTGVSWHSLSSKWHASINVNGKLKYLGLFDNELSASEAYQTELKGIEKLKAKM